MRFLLYVSYIGSTFRGVQRQKYLTALERADRSTVQDELDIACRKHFRKRRTLSNLEVQDEPIKVYSSSRTDAGVHAIRTAFHVDLEPAYSGIKTTGSRVTFLLNKYFELNDVDIRVIESIHVPDTFNARHSAVSRTYLYRFGINRVKDLEKKPMLKLPITEHKRTFLFQATNFDIDVVKEASKLCLGEKDHYAIMGRPSKKPEDKSSIVSIEKLDIAPAKPLMPHCDPHANLFEYWEVTVTARSFLFRLVRRLVGMLLTVGEGKLPLDYVKLLFDKPDPANWSPKCRVLPPHGLYLCDVVYNKQDLIVKDAVEEASKESQPQNKESAAQSNI